MCGACGTGGAAAPWEDLLAGAGPAQRAARAAAADRLLGGGRLRVSTWRGGYVLRTATGSARLAASLDDLWSVAGLPQSASEPVSGVVGRWAWAAVPTGWDVQAAVVWISAAARSGAVTEVALPARADPAGRPVPRLRHGSAGVGVPVSSADRIGVLGPDADAVLDDLVAFASAVRSGPGA